MIPYEDKDDAITPINILFIGGGEILSLMKIKMMLSPQSHIAHRGWQIVIPYEDKDDVITPINILFIEGREC